MKIGLKGNINYAEDVKYMRKGGNKGLVTCAFIINNSSMPEDWFWFVWFLKVLYLIIS